MTKIDTLQINNFKFFDEQEPIEIGGKHLLLYGENGSGKSSIYWALYTLFEATLKKDTEEIAKYFKHHTAHPQSLVNIHADRIPLSNHPKYSEHFNSFIKVITKSPSPTEYQLSLLNTNIQNDSVAKEINQASDFISYKVLYKFQDFWNGEKMDLADIFIGHILSYISFPGKDLLRNGMVETFTNASDMYEEIKKGPGMTTNSNGKKIQVYKYSEENKKFIAFAKHFNNELKNLIDFININAPAILKELGHNIDFELRFEELKYKKADVNFHFTPFKIHFIITSYGGNPITINRPQSFLNEARITAIAIAIRLTVLRKRINAQAGDILKFIVFDDVMISLDMNNRDRLMDFLLDPANNFTSDYQLLFLTHDKSLFDFMIHKINKWSSPTHWVFKEMYTGIDEVKKIEEPVIIDGELSLYDKAKKYYNTKDYTASAIYLRKELEKIVSDRLPKELKYRSDGAFISLQQMWVHLVERFNALGAPITSEIHELFSQTKLLVLNPQAHFQHLSVPLYQVELEKAFDLIDKLKSNYPIPNSTVILDKGAKVKFLHPYINYSFEFELETSFSTNSLKDLSEQITLPRCRILHWQFKDVDFWNIEKNEISKYDSQVNPLLLKLNEVIWINISRKGTEISIENFLENSQVANSLWNLKELCDKSEIIFEKILPPNKKVGLRASFI